MEKKLHLLLIDDDKTMLQLFGGQFGHKGFELIYAHDGAEGWEMARRLKPDLILCDYQMPGMDGMETATHLKGEEITKGIPLIMLTSEDFSPEVQKLLLDTGIDDYLHKALPFTEVLARVKTILTKYGIAYTEPVQE